VTYRDDLTAAHARIATLEAELAAAGGRRSERDNLREERDEPSNRHKELHERSQQELADLRARLVRLGEGEQRAQRELADLRAHPARLRDEHQGAQRELAELQRLAGRAPPEMATSVEHNRARRRSPAVAVPAGVVCPRSLALGERVELGFVAGPSDGLREARGPRCAGAEMVKVD
jgi:hypothetical protein